MVQPLVEPGIILFLLLVFLSLCFVCVLPVILYYGLCYLSLLRLVVIRWFCMVQPGTFWIYLCYNQIFPFRLVFHWCCLCYWLVSYGAASAPAWILLVLPSLCLDPIGAASATAWILLVLPSLLPGSHWCCLGYCLDPIGAAFATAWYSIGAASDSLGIMLVLPPTLPGILLVLPPVYCIPGILLAFPP
jgi:hypothetical protein